ncbi:hypothetical protein [Labilibaculum sp.]|uniref:hypothetical protein n=1 Tax=Labilibaculum sp. TaxID=2060723 RepID=UPI00356A7DA1
MPLNKLKKYPQLLELAHFNEYERRVSLMEIFRRDIEDNETFAFRNKKVRPTKKEGEPSMQTLFHHLTTRNDEDEKGRKLKSRSFEMHRSLRLHWIKYHIEEMKKENVQIFSYEDRDQVNRKDVIRTYIFDKNENYVIVLEPQRSKTDYYLLTAYYINEKKGQKQMKQKYKNKLDEVY